MYSLNIIRLGNLDMLVGTETNEMEIPTKGGEYGSS